MAAYCLEIMDKLNSSFLSDFSNTVQFEYVDDTVVEGSYNNATNNYLLTMDFDTYNSISKYQIYFIPTAGVVDIYKTDILYAPRLTYALVANFAALPASETYGHYYKTADDQQMWGYDEDGAEWVNSVFIPVLLERILGGIEYIPYIMVLLENGMIYEQFGTTNITPTALTGTDYEIDSGTVSWAYNQDSIPVIEISIALFGAVTDYQLVLKRKTVSGSWEDVCIYDEALEDIQIIDYFCPNNQTETDGLIYGISVINNLKIEGREGDMAVSGTLYAATDINSNMIAGIGTDGVLKVYRLIANVQFGQMNLTVNAGVQDTLGGMYPFYIKNSIAEYYKSSISGLVIENFDRCENQLLYENRRLLETRRKEFLSFLGNGLPKVLRTWNGDVLVISVLEGIGYAPNNDLSGTLGSVSFEYVEVASADDYETLADLGITEDLLVIVVEGTMNIGLTIFTKTDLTEITVGDDHHLYYDTSTEIYYRWTGTAFVVQSM